MLVAAFRRLAIDCFLLSCPEIDEGCEEMVTKELSENTLESELSVGLRFRVSFDGELGVEDCVGLPGTSGMTGPLKSKRSFRYAMIERRARL